jgi:hypothetical protein
MRGEIIVEPFCWCMPNYDTNTLDWYDGEYIVVDDADLDELKRSHVCNEPKAKD